MLSKYEVMFLYAKGININQIRIKSGRPLNQVKDIMRDLRTSLWVVFGDTITEMLISDRNCLSSMLDSIEAIQGLMDLHLECRKKSYHKLPDDYINGVKAVMLQKSGKSIGELKRHWRCIDKAVEIEEV